MGDRWIKFYEKIEHSSIYKDSELVHLWIHLLIKATKFPYKVNWGGDEILLKPGELITGRKKLSFDLKIHESKIQRSLKLFEKWHMIEQRTNRQNRIVTILNWDKYQSCEQRMNNERTTSEQRVNTNKKERKKEREKEKENPLKNKISFLENIPDSMKNKYPNFNEKDFEYFTDSIIDYCLSKNKKYSDYYATLRNFIKREPGYKPVGNKSTPMEY